MTPAASASPFTLRRTPLYDLHAEHGGTLIPWHGCEIPSHYSSILDEHQSANDTLALFDLGYRAYFRLEGPDAGKALDLLFPAKISAMSLWELRELPMVYPDGTLVDIMKLARVEEDLWYMIFSNPFPQKSLQWIAQNLRGLDCHWDDLSSEYAWIALSGARAFEYLVCGFPHLERLEPFHVTDALIGGVACRVRRWQPTFFEIGCRPELLAKVIRSWWVSDDHPRLCGWASYENWRLERGILRHGCELKEGVSPIELGWADKIDFAHESFIGRENLLKQQEEDLRHLLIYFSLDAMRLPRAQSPIYCGSRMVGMVCAGGFGPRLRRPIGSAWINTEEVDFDALEVEIRRQRYPLTVRRPPLL